jgi:hypothetical protein
VEHQSSSNKAHATDTSEVYTRTLELYESHESTVAYQTVHHYPPAIVCTLASYAWQIHEPKVFHMSSSILSHQQQNV